MIDKLALTTDEIDLESLLAVLGDTVTTYHLSNIYQKCMKISQSETSKHLMTIYTHPRVSVASPVRIELNPTKLLLPYPEMVRMLDKGINTEAAILQRIDHASDIEMGIEEAFNTIRFKYKRNMRCYNDYQRGCLTGFYIGSKFEQVIIYDKIFELDKRSFKKTHLNIIQGSKTRFELMQKHQKLPIRKICDIPILLDYDPFSSIETYQLDPLLKGVISTGWKGLHNSYQELNRQNNFKRDYKNSLIPSDLKQRITNNYRHNLGQFIQGEIQNENA